MRSVAAGRLSTNRFILSRTGDGDFSIVAATKKEWHNGASVGYVTAKEIFS